MPFATLVWIRASCAILWIALPTHNLSTLSLWGAWYFNTTSAPNLSSPLRFSCCAGRIRLGSFACCQTLTMLMFVVNKWRSIICANMFASTCPHILKKIRTHTYSFDIEKALAMQRPPKEVHITCCSICSIHLWFHTCCLQCSTSWKQMSNARKMYRIKRCKESMSVLQQFLLCIDEMTTSPFSSLSLQHWLSKSYKELASRKFRLWSVCALRLKPISGSSSSSVSSSSSSAWRLPHMQQAHLAACPFPAKVKSKLKKSRDPNVYPLYIYVFICIRRSNPLQHHTSIPHLSLHPYIQSRHYHPP